jgi:hypothetical protein
MKDLLVTHRIAVAALQPIENNRRDDGQYS